MPRFTPYTDWNTEETLRKMLGEPFWRDDWRKEIPTGDQIHDMVNAVRRLKDRLKRLLASKKRSQEDKDYFKPLYESRIKSSNKMLDVDRQRKWWYETFYKWEKKFFAEMDPNESYRIKRNVRNAAITILEIGELGDHSVSWEFWWE